MNGFAERHPRTALLVSIVVLAAVMGWIGAGAAYLVAHAQAHAEFERVCHPVSDFNTAVANALEKQAKAYRHAVTVDKAAIHQVFKGPNQKAFHANRVRQLHKDQALLASTSEFLRHVTAPRC